MLLNSNPAKACRFALLVVLLPFRKETVFRKWMWMKFAQVEVNVRQPLPTSANPSSKCICCVVQLETLHDFFHSKFSRYYPRSNVCMENVVQTQNSEEFYIRYMQNVFTFLCCCLPISQHRIRFQYFYVFTMISNFRIWFFNE